MHFDYEYRYIIYIQHSWHSVIVSDSQDQQVWICMEDEKDHSLARETQEMKLRVFNPQERKEYS